MLQPLPVARKQHFSTAGALLGIHTDIAVPLLRALRASDPALALPLGGLAVHTGAPVRGSAPSPGNNWCGCEQWLRLEGHHDRQRMKFWPRSFGRRCGAPPG